MNRLAAIALFLALPVVAAAQTSTPRGIGVDERLDEPSSLAAAREVLGIEPLPYVFAHLIVPRNIVETVRGNYSFDVLDERLAVLQGLPALLALEGVPRETAEETLWQGYIRAVAERYRGRVLGYVLGRSAGATRNPDAGTYAYLLKLAAIQIRAVDVNAVLLEGNGHPHELDWIESLYGEDIAPYFDGIVSTGDGDIAEIVETVMSHDPSARVIVAGANLGDESEEASRLILIESLSNLADGSAATTFSGNPTAVGTLLNVARELSHLFDGNVVALDEGETALTIEMSDGQNAAAGGVDHHLFFNTGSGSTLLAYWVDPGTDGTPTLDITLRAFAADAPTLHDLSGPSGAGALPVRDFQYDPQQSLASVQVPARPHPLILEIPSPTFGSTVTARVELDVNEIIARHQRAQTRQDNLVASYIASVRDEIHFRAATLDSFDVIMESRFYSDRSGSEWEEISFSFNGARWGSDRPAFPLLQPEKVLSLPLDLRLNQDYAYELVGREKLGDYDCYVVQFEPFSDTRSLYSGRVWIGTESFVKLKVQTVQTELSAPVISNAEVYTYEKQDDVDGTAVYLLTRLSSKQLILIAGRNLLLEKESFFRDFHVNSPDFEQTRQSARGSDHIMLRDTDDGLRYFVKRGGERQVSEELTHSAKALAMGTTVDPSFDFPLPIFGLNYLDFDFLDRDAQFALLFGGIFALGNIQKPNLWGGSFDASLDFFGIAIQSNDVVFTEDGKVDEASLRTVPASAGVNVGWQFTPFQKLSARYDLRYDWYGRSETTAEAFVTPVSTLTNGFTMGYEFRRRGYSLLGSGSYARRADWKPWGDVSTFDPSTESYWKYRVVLGKDFFLNTFHKIHVDAGYFGGDRLDRFTSYQFGLFDETRVRGVPSTAVRFDELILARASYSFNVFDQFRFELFYDRAWGDDPERGLDRVSFSGLGVGLNVRGPWHTIVRVDVGKSFLPEALRGAGTVVTQFLVLKPL